MATLDQLVAVRSQLAIGLAAYLRYLADREAWPVPPFVGDRQRLLALYQAPDVRPRDGNAPQRPRSTAQTEQEEFGREDWSRDRLQWDAVWRTIRRAVVLGVPGQGKSLLTQTTVATIARESLKRVTDRKEPLASVPIPIWLRVEQVMKARSLREAVESHAGAMVGAALKRQFRKPEARPAPDGVVAHLVHALERDATWLFLDALDESPWNAEVFHRELASLPCRIVITCRPYAYRRQLLPFAEPGTPAAGPDLVEYDLAPLTPNQRDVFIEKWLGRDTDAWQRVEWLVRNTRRLPDLMRNAQLLTLVCSVCSTGGGRPFDRARTSRVHLYEWAIDDIVRRAHKPTPPRASEAELASFEVNQRSRVLSRVARVLFEAHPDDGIFSVKEWLGELEKAEPLDAAFRERLTNDLFETGFLVEPMTGAAKFIHRSFHEYLTAVAWVEEGAGTLVAAIGARVDDLRFREVIEMAIGYLGLIHKLGDHAEASRVVDTIIAQGPGKRGSAAARMGQALVDASPAAVNVGTRNAVVRALLPAMGHDTAREGEPTAVPFKTRVEAGDALGWLGDTRFREDRWFLPAEHLLGFVKIPDTDEQPFVMGSDPRRDVDARGEEQPAASVLLPAFFIARYPVTVAQFRAFAQDSENGGFIPDNPDCLNGVPNHPIVNVTWPEALAYCRWLTGKLRHETPLQVELTGALGDDWRATLPSEAEWERAARGTGGRIYPWGDGADVNRANYWNTAIRATTAVGCFPEGASPYRIMDLSGNVREWTRSLWGRDRLAPTYIYPYLSNDGRENLAVRAGDLRVVRGGDFNSQSRFIRAACRWSLPVDRSPAVGFRVVVIRSA